MNRDQRVLALPARLSEALDQASDELLVSLLERGLQDLRIELVLQRYANGEMSFGAAAQEVNVSIDVLSRQAYARGLQPPYSEATFREELS